MHAIINELITTIYKAPYLSIAYAIRRRKTLIQWVIRLQITTRTYILTYFVPDYDMTTW